MDLIIKNRNVQPIAVVDMYNSAIWAERYADVGEFQLIMPVNSSYLDYLQIDNYVTIKDSDRAMIIESMELESDVTTGKKVVAYSGSSLESILKRRIVWGQTTLTGTIEYVISELIDKNIVHASPSTRIIPNFVYSSVTDPVLLSYIQTIGNVKCQFTGDTIFDAIKSICDPLNIGFKITFDDNGNFVFSLYYGTNRTAEQTLRDAVIFSPEYDTLISSRYVANFTEYKNITLVLGEDSGASRKRKIVYSTSSEPTGLDRRELYTDARDLQSEDEHGSTMSDADYYKLLERRGLSKLNENSITTAFDGEVETSIGPVYNQDYFLGDFVSTINEYGLGATAQITEYVRSFDENGYSAYPTFVMIN